MSETGNIDIQPAELRNIAGRIKTQKDNLSGYFEAIAMAMKNLENEGWKSDSGRALQEKFNRLRNFYNDKYPPAMQDYINYLNKTADAYEARERAAKQDVDGLSNMGQ